MATQIRTLKDGENVVLPRTSSNAVVTPRSKTLEQELSDKLNKNQGSENAGKFLVVGDDGNVVTADLPLYDGGVN